jgi:integrase
VAALSTADLQAIVSTLGSSTRDIRDAAILLVGFAGAFRRSELAAIDCTDIRIDRAGVIIGIPRGKADQEGHGRAVAIPRASGPICPVAALERWLAVSRGTEGAVFRAVTKAGKVMPAGLSSTAIASVVKARVQAIGRDASRYSGHSLRAGFATAAAAVGVPQWRIKAQTGHLSDAVLGRYIREGELSAGNELAVIFEPPFEKAMTKHGSPDIGQADERLNCTRIHLRGT